MSGSERRGLSLLDDQAEFAEGRGWCAGGGLRVEANPGLASGKGGRAVGDDSVRCGDRGGMEFGALRVDDLEPADLASVGSRCRAESAGVEPEVQGAAGLRLTGSAAAFGHEGHCLRFAKPGQEREVAEESDAQDASQG